MQKLIEGVHRFRAEEFGRFSELFQRLSNEGQKPHTLFITCADSRILAELITHSEPGDLFVVKNVGNIVPPNDRAAYPNSTAAAIEFAVSVLGVEDVVICGHSQCGAMTALVADDFHECNDGCTPSDMPNLRSWLSIAAPVRELIDRDYGHLTDIEKKITAASEENVLFGVENLKTYPAVRASIEAGKLLVHAWFFKIATAELFAYDPVNKQFMPLVIET